MASPNQWRRWLRLTAGAAGRAGGVGGTRADQSERSNGAMGVVRNGAWPGALGTIWGHLRGFGDILGGSERGEREVTGRR